MSRYLRFELSEELPKTKVWCIFSKTSNGYLGNIKWFSRWRQYCFYPNNETIFNSECLDDIKNFLKDKMDSRKRVSGN